MTDYSPHEAEPRAEHTTIVANEQLPSEGRLES
jgi:hypothetical protein